MPKSKKRQLSQSSASSGNMDIDTSHHQERPPRTKHPVTRVARRRKTKLKFDYKIVPLGAPSNDYPPCHLFAVRERWVPSSNRSKLKHERRFIAIVGCAPPEQAKWFIVSKQEMEERLCLDVNQSQRFGKEIVTTSKEGDDKLVFIHELTTERALDPYLYTPLFGCGTLYDR